MSSAFRRTLPARPDLEQQKKLAKELLRAFNAGDATRSPAFAPSCPDKRSSTLTDAQFVLAREYGFASWRELKDRIEQLAAERVRRSSGSCTRFSTATQPRCARCSRARGAFARAINAPIFAFDSPAIVPASRRSSRRRRRAARVRAPTRTGAATGGRVASTPSTRARRGGRALLAAGAMPDACAAAQLDRRDLLSRMLADDPARVHERGGDGQTPLHFARSREVVDLLLDAGADIDARDVDHRSTAAQWMLGDGAGSPRWELARYLVERGATADIFLAAALGLTDRVRAMLEADPSLLRLRHEHGRRTRSSRRAASTSISGRSARTILRCTLRRSSAATKRSP